MKLKVIEYSRVVVCWPYYKFNNYVSHIKVKIEIKLKIETYFNNVIYMFLTTGLHMWTDVFLLLIINSMKKVCTTNSLLYILDIYMVYEYIWRIFKMYTIFVYAPTTSFHILSFMPRI